ncbi:MAG: glycoside hydrolase family 3 protein [Bacilli bacterium]|nr:glycoside hydrolase family 3 protein [Bacilli bacterium]
MKKIIVFVLFLLLAGCSNIKENTKEVKKETIKKDKIDIMLENMSIEEKIAQMLIIEYDSDYVDDNLKSFLNSTPPGGFILMKENITTFDKTRQFVSDLKENSMVPLIISIDEEGGSVQRLKYLMDARVSDIPFMYNVGLTNNYDLAYNIGEIIAEEVRTIGVNVDFAPVIDIYSNSNNTVIGKRSFGSDAEIVSNMAVRFTKGLEDNGVIGVYKHFPGHGDTDIDSHEALPIINKSLDDLKSFELVPFESAVKTGAKMIMVGHIAIPEVTHDNTPASLSKEVIDILKNDLNYDGLIVTDALNMGAISDNYSNEEAYIKAIEAGNDLLLIPSDGINTINIIKDKVSLDRINESARKILKFKYGYLDKDNFLDKSYLGSEEHAKIISQIP